MGFTVSISGGTVEGNVAGPAMIATCHIPRVQRRVAVDRHAVVVNALRPHIRRKLDILTAYHCRNETLQRTSTVHEPSTQQWRFYGGEYSLDYQKITGGVEKFKAHFRVV